MKIRLQKILAGCGVASRRKVELLIKAGKIKVNEVCAKIGDKVDLQRDRITIFDKPVAIKDEKYYVMLYKPRGYITTMHDERDRKNVSDLVKNIPNRIYPIGRLDKDSEGLLLMTNDGDFANKLMHPSNHVPRTYRVTVKQHVEQDKLDKIRAGMIIDGNKTQPAQALVVRAEEGRTVLNITLFEGKNRQIRKICEELGLEVKRLKRISIGNVKLGMLRPGSFRKLTISELMQLGLH
jgi:23S rRNA pseudouridine2605 synthase